MKYTQTLTVTSETSELTGKTILWRGLHGECTSPERVRTKRVVRGDVEMTIDLQKLVEKLGRRCLLSKSGRSVGLKGLIKVKKVTRTEVSREVETNVLKANEQYV